MLIKLDDGSYVAADQISEVKYNLYSGHITVRTKDGVGHSVFGNHADMDLLINTINKAMEKP